MQQTKEKWVWFLGWEDPQVEYKMAIHSSILVWKIPWTEDLVGYSPWGCKESNSTEWLRMHAYILCSYFLRFSYCPFSVPGPHLAHHISFTCHNPGGFSWLSFLSLTFLDFLISLSFLVLGDVGSFEDY